MKKALAIFLLLTLNLVVFGQSKKFYRYTLPAISENLDSSLDSYVGTRGKDLQRNSAVDSLAKARANYFLDVIEVNSGDGKTFSSMLNQIPNDHSAHDSIFGNSTYFKSPQSEYPYLFRFFPCLDLEAKSEIMQEIVWKGSYDKKMDAKEISRIAVDSRQKEINNTVAWDLLDGYKKSKPHHDAIKKWGNGKYGISTRVLVAEEKIGNKWVYEVMIYNVVVFTGKI